MRRMERGRQELSEFLQSRRARLKPTDVGLPAGSRRRTPGLRREEVAALAGVGLTWYTWLEQGREISVSASFLDNLCRVLKMDAEDRRYLYLLTQNRPPSEPGKTWCVVPPVIHRLMADLTVHPAYVLNLRWDVLAWNQAAERIFGFSRMQPGMRNFLWMVFMDPVMRTVLSPWKEQAQNVISLFRRDYVKARQEADFSALVKSLEDADPDFRTWMSEHDVSGISAALCHFDVSNIGCVPFQCTALTINENQHLRLICYVAEENNKNGRQFEKEILSAREK